VIDLPDIYRRALAECAPDVLMRRLVWRRHSRRWGLPRTVVAIGKCAGPLLDGFGDFDAAFVAIPSGYPRPKREAIVFEGGHPEMTPASFAAGRALIEFVDAHRHITFLISGGGSACVEVPLEPFSEEELMQANARLIRSGEPISAINRERKRMSAIKGGRLAQRVRGRIVTFVYSDVATGRLADVASGPTIANDTEVHLIADNSTLVSAAANLCGAGILAGDSLDVDVQAAAKRLAQAAMKLRSGEVLIAGGEPTVSVTGNGRGGRCTELALRFALAAPNFKGDALFASSDGVDGNSGGAGVLLRLPAAFDAAEIERELNASNSAPIAARIGTLLPMCPTGNNLRDLYLLACS
jgi:glycerate 2-kinase